MPPPKGSPTNNPKGRPRSDTVKLTRAARERFDRSLAIGIDDLFVAAYKAATEDKDTAALSLLVNRAVPIRRGSPVSFQTRPLTTANDCAMAYSDILAAVGKGQLTPAEAADLAVIVSHRVGLFGTIELADEIAALKAQLAALGPRPTLRAVPPA